jgi:hypothetical protein
MTTYGILSTSGFQPTGLPALWGNSYWQNVTLFPNLLVFVLQVSFSTKRHGVKIAAPSALGLPLLDLDY